MRGGGLFVFGNGTSQEVSRMREDQDVDLGRSSGILLHPTSLPGGRLGDEAYRFVDWLAAAGQSWWQILPLGPPDESGSPYAAQSAFAGWAGLLAEPDAHVSAEEIEAYVPAHPASIGGWPGVAWPAGRVSGRVAPWRAVSGAARRALGPLPLSAEGLGTITEPVERLRDDLRLPGMVILQVSFSEGLKNPQELAAGALHRVFYTGTH